MKRSPSSATRTADLVPRAWIPGAGGGAAAARLYRCVGPDPRSIGLAGLLLLAALARGPAAHRRRPRARGRRSHARRGGIPEGGRRAAARKDTAFYNAGHRGARGRPAGRGARGARRGREIARPGAPLSRALQSRTGRPARRPRGQRARGRAARRRGGPAAAGPAAPSPRPPAPSGIWSWPSAAARPRLRRAAGAATPPPTGGTPGAAAQAVAARRPKDLRQSQAEQILNSMERRERLTREEQQRRMQTGSAGGVKDW